ncbi:hypothetical protein Tco_0596207 [Tanacetum coccineum]
MASSEDLDGDDLMQGKSVRTYTPFSIEDMMRSSPFAYCLKALQEQILVMASSLNSLKLWHSHDLAHKDLVRGFTSVLTISMKALHYSREDRSVELLSRMAFVE